MSIICGTVGGNLLTSRFWSTIKARGPSNLYVGRLQFLEILPTTRLKSNICGGDDGVCNEGHKLQQSQCETTAKISRDLGRPHNNDANQLCKFGAAARKAIALATMSIV